MFNPGDVVLELPPSLTAVDLSDRFGPIPLSRFCFDPLPGRATEQDVLDLRANTKRLFELIDGILVEKPMGWPEAFLAIELARWLGNWVVPRNLGAVVGADGMMRLAPGLIRIPDVTFVYWDRIPGRRIDVHVSIPDLFPDLAVEVLSPSNTAAEMALKLRDYFGCGASLVWLVDPRREPWRFTLPPMSPPCCMKPTPSTAEPSCLGSHYR